MHRGSVLDRAGQYSIIDCDECGFVHIDPLPTPEQLDEIYSGEYYSEEKPEFIDNVIKDIEWWTTVFDSRYDYFESRLPALSRSLLDVGCGPGYFLKRGVDRGWQVTGIEPSVQAADHAEKLGIEVINAFLDSSLRASFTKEDRSFDAVHLSEVLEHTRDPLSVLSQAYSLLNDGGIICCVVPNDYSPVQKVLVEKLGYSAYWLAPPHHINYFSFGSLAALMRKAGFEVVEQSAMFPIDFFLLMGENYVGNDKLGRDCHTKRKQLEIMLEAPELKSFKQELCGLMAAHGIGREMIIYGRKAT